MTTPDNIPRDQIPRDQIPSQNLLTRLARLNPTAVFLAAVVFVLIALFAPGAIGGVLLLAIATVLLALLAKTWPVQAPQTRMFRMVMLTMLVGVALIKTF